MSLERFTIATAARFASKLSPDSPSPTAERTAFLPRLAPVRPADASYAAPPRGHDVDTEEPFVSLAAADASDLSYMPATSGLSNRSRAEMTSSAISEAAETAASLIAASEIHEHDSVLYASHRVGTEVSAAAGGQAAESAVQPAKRKSSSDFLRKGQWTTTEERLARRLIMAFEEGYLPIYTGIRLRGYLAVQLQCDPMRVSKKLCAGTVDGKRVPKNYGQKKFKLRKKANWDRDEAARILVVLEQLTDEMWRESAVPRPSFLTLSSTRNADEEEPPAPPRDIGRVPASPVRRLSPSVSKKHKSVVFPIIYLNLSKKRKQHPSACANHSSSSGSGGSSGSEADPVGDSAPWLSEDEESRGASKKAKKARSESPRPVDGESLQAAYDLLMLCQTRQPGGTSDTTKSAAAAGASPWPLVVRANAP